VAMGGRRVPCQLFELSSNTVGPTYELEATQRYVACDLEL